MLMPLRRPGVFAALPAWSCHVLAGLLMWCTRPVQSSVVQRALGPLGRVRDSCRAELGRHLGALGVLLMGAAAAVIVSWPFGRFAKRFTPNLEIGRAHV